MSAIAYKVSDKGGGYVKATPIPANRSEQTHFGPVDRAVIAAFFVTVCGAVLYLFLA